MTFLRTSAETDGECVLIELHAEPQAFVAAAHVHPAQVETFEIVSGTLGAKVADKKSRRRQVMSSSWSLGKHTSGGTPARGSSCFVVSCVRRLGLSR